MSATIAECLFGWLAETRQGSDARNDRTSVARWLPTVPTTVEPYWLPQRAESAPTNAVSHLLSLVPFAYRELASRGEKLEEWTTAAKQCFHALPLTGRATLEDGSKVSGPLMDVVKDQSVDLDLRRLAFLASAAVSPAIAPVFSLVEGINCIEDPLKSDTTRALAWLCGAGGSETGIKAHLIPFAVNAAETESGRRERLMGWTALLRLSEPPSGAFWTALPPTLAGIRMKFGMDAPVETLIRSYAAVEPASAVFRRTILALSVDLIQQAGRGRNAGYPTGSLGFRVREATRAVIEQYRVTTS